MTGTTLHDLFARLYARSVERVGPEDADDLLAVGIRVRLADLATEDAPEIRAALWGEVAALAIERVARSWIGVGGVGTPEGDVAQAAHSYAFGLGPAAPLAIGPLVDVIACLDRSAVQRSDERAVSMIVGLLREDAPCPSVRGNVQRTLRTIALTTAIAQGVAASANPLETTRADAVADFAAMLEGQAARDALAEREVAA